MVELKLQGYLERHEVGAMPLDSADFVADHILVYQGTKPVLGVKTLLFDLCSVFKIDFTLEAFLAKGGHHAHLRALKRIMEEAKARGNKIAYYSSWTMAPHTRKSPENVAFLKELFTGLTYLYHKHEGIPEILGATLPKFKTDEFCQAWGFERFSENGVPLPAIPAPIFAGVDYVAMHLQRYSGHAINCAEKYSRLWHERSELGVSYANSRFCQSSGGDLNHSRIEHVLRPIDGAAHSAFAGAARELGNFA
jgi:hypothetical protein